MQVRRLPMPAAGVWAQPHEHPPSLRVWPLPQWKIPAPRRFCWRKLLMLPAPATLPHPGKLCWPPWFFRQPRCPLAAGQCQEQFPVDSWIFFTEFNCSVSFLRLVFPICGSLGLVKFISPCCGNIFSSERWEQSQLNPCKSNEERTCCPKVPAWWRVVEKQWIFFSCCSGMWDLCCLLWVCAV